MLTLAWNKGVTDGLSAAWGASWTGDTLEQLVLRGHDFLICPNTRLPINDDSVDLVITNSVPIDRVVLGDPRIESGQVRRILAPGGRWVHDGKTAWCKQARDMAAELLGLSADVPSQRVTAASPSYANLAGQ